MENVSRDSSGPHNAYGALRLSMLVPHMWGKTPSLWYEVLLSGEGDMPAQRSETIPQTHSLSHPVSAWLLFQFADAIRSGKYLIAHLLTLCGGSGGAKLDVPSAE